MIMAITVPARFDTYPVTRKSSVGTLDSGRRQRFRVIAACSSAAGIEEAMPFAQCHRIGARHCATLIHIDDPRGLLPGGPAASVLRRKRDGESDEAGVWAFVHNLVTCRDLKQGRIGIGELQILKGRGADVSPMIGMFREY
jgi:hypothetical protein